MNIPFLVRVPATTANIGPGFDVLGMALSLLNSAEIYPDSDGTQDNAGIRIDAINGEGADSIPYGADNLFVRSMRHYANHAGLALPGCRLKIDNQIPLARGLGSSAATIVGGLAAAATLLGRDLDRGELLQLADDIEGHPDNVAAAIYGGLVIAYRGDTTQAEPPVAAATLDVSSEISTLLLIPKEEVSTEEARGALENSVGRSDAVFNIARCSMLVAGLIQGDFSMIEKGAQDRLHQPQRLPLFPHFRRAQELLFGNGIANMVLSGAGPTMLSFVRRQSAEETRSRIASAIIDSELPIDVVLGEISRTGVEITPLR